LCIGFLHDREQFEEEERVFLNLAKKKGIDLVMIDIFKDAEKEDFRDKIKQCDFFYNNTAKDFVIEVIKTIEETGKKVVDNSRAYYYTTDKWMSFVKFKEHNIPTPDTILLSENIPAAKQELKEFGKWPVVLKRVIGTMGQYVDKADNAQEAERIIKRFWKKGAERLPIIAQEFIPSPSYRVTTIGRKIVQTALKKCNTWKATGVYGIHFEKFKIDKDLKKIVDKVIRATKINICGIDLLKKDGKWLVLELNSEPGLDFFEKERKKLIGLILDFLKGYGKTYL